MRHTLPLSLAPPVSLSLVTPPPPPQVFLDLAGKTHSCVVHGRTGTPGVPSATGGSTRKGPERTTQDSRTHGGE